MEVWADIKGYEGLYQVSNFGNVRSLNWRNRREMINLFLKPHSRGYLQVELHKYGKRKMFTVHRLVALHFVPGYSSGKVVNHKNEVKTDNRAENLEWVSSSYNAQYSKSVKYDTPICQYSRGGKFIRQWASPIAIRNALGYSDWSIKECCRGNRQQAYGYVWRFAT